MVAGGNRKGPGPLNSTDPQKSRHHLIIDRNNVCNDHHRLSPQVNKMKKKKKKSVNKTDMSEVAKQ